MRFFCIAILVLHAYTGLAQAEKPTFEIQTSIRRVELLDTFLVNQLESFISEAKKSDTDFQRYGYVSLLIGQGRYKGKSALKSYWLVKDYGSFDNDENDHLFRPYYSVVGGKLVSIGLSDLSPIVRYRFTAEEKRKFQAIAEPYLFPKPDERRNTFPLHGGTYIWIFAPPTPPVVLTAQEAGIY